jgi:hypothetical protein
MQQAAAAPGNEEIAELLERVAELLEAQAANAFRVRAYRRAAERLRVLERPAARLLAEGGREALQALPGIGATLAAQIDEIAHRGRLAMLDRLEGEVSPEDLFTTLPGVGEELARRLHDRLHVDTLEELEIAAHDGRLAEVPGIGPRRAAGIRHALEHVLGRSARLRARARRRVEAARERSPGPVPPDSRPSVALLLGLDEEYRTRASAGQLRRITPRRFNPERRDWLPVMHAEREGWSFHLLFSNTARAHELGRTHDWVVIYFERDGEEDQCTVVTETRGRLAGLRVVRGREPECARYHDVRGELPPTPAP